jgi:hypothetical protein
MFTVGVPLFNMPQKDGFVTTVVDELWIFDGAQRMKPLRPHSSFFQLAIGPV